MLNNGGGGAKLSVLMSGKGIMGERSKIGVCVCGGGGGQVRPPPPTRVSKKCVVELSRKKQRLLSTSTIGDTFLDARSIFDPLMRGQRSNFPEADNFPNLHAYAYLKHYNSQRNTTFTSVFLFQILTKQSVVTVY